MHKDGIRRPLRFGCLGNVIRLSFGIILMERLKCHNLRVSILGATVEVRVDVLDQ